MFCDMKQLDGCALTLCWRTVLLKLKMVLCFDFMKTVKCACDRRFTKV